MPCVWVSPDINVDEAIRSDDPSFETRETNHHAPFDLQDHSTVPFRIQSFDSCHPRVPMPGVCVCVWSEDRDGESLQTTYHDAVIVHTVHINQNSHILLPTPRKLLT